MVCAPVPSPSAGPRSPYTTPALLSLPLCCRRATSHGEDICHPWSAVSPVPAVLLHFLHPRSRQSFYLVEIWIQRCGGCPATSPGCLPDVCPNPGNRYLHHARQHVWLDSAHPATIAHP